MNTLPNPFMEINKKPVIKYLTYSEKIAKAIRIERKKKAAKSKKKD